MLLKTGRYSIEKLSEAEYEPDSKEKVLKNLQNIKSKRKIDLLEASLFEQTINKLVDTYDQFHTFTAENICKIHRAWLGSVYTWAGEYRRVNMSKDDFPFAAAYLIPQLMKTFEATCLRKFTPCRFKTLEKIVEALAIVHTELVLIHPFREGNGRIARLLSSLMAFQAGFAKLDFVKIEEKKRPFYFRAVQAGLGKNYDPMKHLFKEIIAKNF